VYDFGFKTVKKKQTTGNQWDMTDATTADVSDMTNTFSLPDWPGRTVRYLLCQGQSCYQSRTVLV
jgi:hypothetical protein